MMFFDIFRRNIVANCGHKTKKKDTVSALWASCTIKLSIVNGTTEYCHCCLEEMTIRCAWCGGAIFIGAPITLYTPSEKNFKIPEYAVVYNKEPLQLVGCLRYNCALSGADRAGFWYPPGKVWRVLSPLEISLRNIKNGQSGTVVVGDLGNPAEAYE